VATYLLNILPTKTLGFATPHFALHGVLPTYDHLRVFGCAIHATRTSLPQPLISLHCVLHSVSFSATLLITRGTTALIAPRIGSSSLVMCPLTRPRFPLLSHPDLSARQTLSSWMILLLTCRPHWTVTSCFLYRISPRRRRVATCGPRRSRVATRSLRRPRAATRGQRHPDDITSRRPGTP